MDERTKAKEALLPAKEARRLFKYDPTTGILTRRVGVQGINGKAGSEVGYVVKRGYRIVMVAGVTYQAHRVIWLIQTGRWPVGEVDHERGDKDDNRWSKLRDVTHRENGCNQKRRSDNTS